MSVAASSANAAIARAIVTEVLTGVDSNAVDQALQDRETAEQTLVWLAVYLCNLPACVRRETGGTELRPDEWQDFCLAQTRAELRRAAGGAA